MERKVLCLLKLYYFSTLVCAFLWIVFPGACDFIGAGSWCHAMLFALGTENAIFLVLSFLWILLLIIGIPVFGRIAQNEQKYGPFCFAMVLDLLISLLLILYKVYTHNHADLYRMVFGLFTRSLYCVVTIKLIYNRCITEAYHEGNDY